MQCKFIQKCQKGSVAIQRNCGIAARGGELRRFRDNFPASAMQSKSDLISSLMSEADGKRRRVLALAESTQAHGLRGPPKLVLRGVPRQNSSLRFVDGGNAAFLVVLQFYGNPSPAKRFFHERNEGTVSKSSCCVTRYDSHCAWIHQ